MREQSPLLIALRAACSQSVGTGHLRRCLTLAEWLNARGQMVVVFTDDSNAAHAIAGGVGIEVRFLSSSVLLPTEIVEHIGVLVVDVPAGPHGLLTLQPVLAQIEELDRTGVSLVSLGHVAHGLPLFRAIIDLYPTAEVTAANYLEGPDYLILRPEFIDKGRPVSSEPSGIVICMGGTDPFGLTQLAIRALSHLGWEEPVHVVIGGANTISEADLRQLGDELNLQLYCHREINADALVVIMRQCKVCLVSFGTVAYEAMCLGLPVLALTHYAWQESSAQRFEALGALKYAGCAERGLSVETVATALTLFEDSAFRETLGRRGAEFVDGCGAERVADLLCGFQTEAGERTLDDLFIVAHPGDEVFGCGGTLLKRVIDGRRVGVVILSEGIASRYGVHHPEQVVLSASSRVKFALQTAMREMNVASWYYCRFQDNRFDGHDLLDLVKAIEPIVDRHDPERIYTHHPGDLNIDHRKTYEAVATVVRSGAGRRLHSLLSIEVPSSSDWGTMLGGQPFWPTWFENVETTLEKKMELVDIYDFETKKEPHPRAVKAIRHRAAHWGRFVGLSAAEAFVLQRYISGKEQA